MSNVEYFIGGGGDKGDWITTLVGSSHIMKAVAAERAYIFHDLLVEYRGHEERQSVLLDIKGKWKSGEYTSIRLTGHSWGGQAAIKICQALWMDNIPVDELITLDPVSVFPLGKVYAKKWVNIYIPRLF